jgi:hypothetical protein
LGCKIVAVIRHPFDVLSSWDRAGELPVGNGFPPDDYWPETAAIAASDVPHMEKAVQLYDAYIQRYHELREHIHIVKYEDMIENPLLVSQLFSRKKPPALAHQIMARPRMLLGEQTEKWQKALEKYGVYTRQYYTDL